MTPKQNFGSDYGSLIAAIFRVIGFFTLIVVMTPVHVFFALRKPDEPFRISQLFHRYLLKLLGFRVRVHGAIATSDPTLFVSNHASYLDIPVLGALVPAAFVAKAEVANWPIIGWLAKMQHSVFIERRSTKVSDQRGKLQSQLSMRRNLLLFPEGTSSDGLTVLPFKSSLFSIVEDTAPDLNITIQPISITCTELDGLPITRAWRPYYAWYGDMTLVSHLWNVFKFGHFTVDVVFHPTIKPSDFADRKAIAAYCQQQVAKGIELCLTGRHVDAMPEMLKLPAPMQASLPS